MIWAEKRTRDKAVKNLAAFLSQAPENALSKSEMDKLWKGIFYCALLSAPLFCGYPLRQTGFWMSDKPLVQQALASELAELLLTIGSTTTSLVFLRGFWATIVREWNGIDRLRYVSWLSFLLNTHAVCLYRIDKYYMLIRRFVNASFRLLIRENWEEKACSIYNDILISEGGPLRYGFSIHSLTCKLSSRKSGRYTSTNGPT